MRLVGAGIARPWPWATTAKFPGGYGIRPYAVGVGVPDDPGMLPLPQSSGERARLAPYPFFPCNRFAIGFSTP